MNCLIVSPALRPSTGAQIAAIEAWIERHRGDTQVELTTEHHLHAGVYSRTLYVPADTMVAGVFIKVPTQLIVSGHCVLTDGSHDREFEGYHVLDGAAGRQCVALTLKPTAFTMLFATNAKTVEEAEKEFTDQPERLATNKEPLECREQLLQ